MQKVIGTGTCGIRSYFFIFPSRKLVLLLPIVTPTKHNTTSVNHVNYSATCLERPLPWETTYLERPDIPGRWSNISMLLIETVAKDHLPWKTTIVWLMGWFFKTGSTVLTLPVDKGERPRTWPLESWSWKPVKYTQVGEVGRASLRFKYYIIV